ncbi:MAG: hypothetical protein EZS28_043884 [Streblomastix strix]|uniref:Uncharacterized protein n=1 Tax=Streblomastix strix TaxID=222440 RepID=A0A5J4TRR3_9EUKA|nr:MAG: hypothetical protein EZS28_043884 [Streblomastix strix]
MIIQNEIQSTSDDLLSIFKSIPIAESEHSKLEIVNKIHSQIKLLGEGNSFSEINIELFKEFAQQIREGRSEVEKGLLNVVLTIAELGSDIVDIQCNSSIFTAQINQIQNIQNRKNEE